MFCKVKKTVAVMSILLAAPISVGVTHSMSAVATGQSSSVAAETNVKFTTTWVSVRRSPTSKAAVIRELPKGAKVKVVGTQKGWSDEKKANVSWSNISTGGWIRSDLLTASEPKRTAQKRVLEWTTSRNTITAFRDRPISESIGAAKVVGEKGDQKRFDIRYRLVLPSEVEGQFVVTRYSDPAGFRPDIESVGRITLPKGKYDIALVASLDGADPITKYITITVK